MSSYPFRRGTLHLGMFSEEEARNLLSLGRLLPGDEVQLPQGWVPVGSAFATSPSVAIPANFGGGRPRLYSIGMG